MIDTQAIRSKILDLAMCGQLTEQLPEDGTAEELYQQIQAEKQALIKAGKIKKEKPLPEIKEQEKPFEIPENWKWIRWGDIVNIVSARRVHQSDWRDSGVPFYRAREIAKLAEDGFVKNDLYISEKMYAEFSKSGVPRADDLMVSAVGTLGRTYVVKENERFYYKDASVLCFENFGKINPYFLAYAMKSNMMRQQIESNSGGTTVDTLTMIRMVLYLCPLPPLAEQKRIVEKIEQTFSILDTIDELQKEYADNMAVLKSKLIDLAIQGKLTEQLPEDGTAEELYQQIQAEKQMLIKAGKIKKGKPSKIIAEGEMPFVIPNNWKWIRLKELGIFCGGKTPSMENEAYWKNGNITWVTSKDMKQKYIGASEMLISEKGAHDLTILPALTVLFVVRSGILRRMFPVAILTRNGTINQDLKALQLFVPEMSEFVYYLLKGFESKILFKYTKDGTTVNNIVFNDLLEMPIPLPPLAEQKRIIESLNRITESF